MFLEKRNTYRSIIWESPTLKNYMHANDRKVGFIILHDENKNNI